VAFLAAGGAIAVDVLLAEEGLFVCHGNSLPARSWR
jgi:hypothetical protein